MQKFRTDPFFHSFMLKDISKYFTFNSFLRFLVSPTEPEYMIFLHYPPYGLYEINSIIFFLPPSTIKKKFNYKTNVACLTLQLSHGFTLCRWCHFCNFSLSIKSSIKLYHQTEYGKRRQMQRKYLHDIEKCQIIEKHPLCENHDWNTEVKYNVSEDNMFYSTSVVRKRHLEFKMRYERLKRMRGWPIWFCLSSPYHFRLCLSNLSPILPTFFSPTMAVALLTFASLTARNIEAVHPFVLSKPINIKFSVHPLEIPATSRSNPI